MLERDFQKKIKKEIKEHIKDSIVIKMDANDIQGIPDILVLHKNKWATLEFKKSKNAQIRDNQKFYVDKMDKMSFSKIIYPENYKTILDDMYHYLMEE